MNRLKSETQNRGVHKLKHVRGLSRRRSHTNNRYALLTIIISLAMTVILLRTASLQLAGSHEPMIPISYGQGRDVLLEAPRGDIVDANGIPLATSEPVFTIAIVSADLDTMALNRMLLDLSELLEAYDVASESRLSEYVAISGESKKALEADASSDLSFVFKKSADEIRSFQMNDETFGLLDPSEIKKERDRAKAVRTSPNDFFGYMLYDAFQIEPDRKSGNRLYTDYEAYRIMEMRYLLLENHWLFTIGKPIVVAKEVPDGLISRLTEQNYRFPGIAVSRQYTRCYTNESNLVSHALGYVGRISESEYDALRSEGYGISDMVGKTGVEASAERWLRGTPGSYALDTWNDDESGGRVTYPGEVARPPVAGHEVKLTLSLNLQRIARENLQRKMLELRGYERSGRVMTAPAGCVIAMDAKTGAVLVNANLPDFRVTDFVDQWHDPAAAWRVQQNLTDSEGLPMLNRGIAHPYTPGSTFKVVTSMAGFESGVIKPGDTVYRCNGTEKIGGLTWRCLEEPHTGHGDLDVQHGLITSCNLYFYHLGVDVGIDRIDAMAKKLGLGESTGVDIPGEALGTRANRANKVLLNDKPEDQQWFIADTCQSSIGQFYNSYTMLQIARAVNGVATGYLVTPHMIKEVRAEDGSMVVPEQIERIPLNLDEAGRAIIKDGMHGLTTWHSGRTARLFKDFPVEVGAKTGTAEVLLPDGTMVSNAVYVCFAPVDDPEIVIAHIIEDASYGDQTCDIAYRILCEYFGVEPIHDYMGPYDPDSSPLGDGFGN